MIFNFPVGFSAKLTGENKEKEKFFSEPVAFSARTKKKKKEFDRAHFLLPCLLRISSASSLFLHPPTPFSSLYLDTLPLNPPNVGQIAAKSLLFLLSLSHSSPCRENSRRLALVKTYVDVEREPPPHVD